MLVYDVIKISVRQIYRYKRRFISAVLGMGLGIAGLITMFTAGDSVETFIGMNLELLGHATVIKVEWHSTPEKSWHRGDYMETDVEDLRKLPGVLAVSGTVWMDPAKVTHRQKKANARIGGVEEEYFRVNHLPLVEGRGLVDKDIIEYRHVCVIGQEIEEELFGDEPSAIYKQVVVRGVALTVVGVLNRTEDPRFGRTLFLPLTVGKGRIKGMQDLNPIYVRADGWDVMPSLLKNIKRLLKTNHPGYEDSMWVHYNEDIVTWIRRIVFLFQSLSVCAIVVTLILGGLGITNVMLAMVTERTTEIGLRKAVGATEGIILFQFLCESLTAGLVSAALGSAVGAAALELLEHILGTTHDYRVLILSILGSAVLGVCLGVLSGVVPALRASKLDPVDAMRFE